jgi:hypothetical protein
MADSVAKVSISMLKKLWQLAVKGELTAAELETAAAEANMTTGELMWGIFTQQEGQGAATGFAQTVYSAISRLPEAPELTAAMNEAAREAASTAIELVEAGEVVETGGAAGSALVRILTAVGQLLVPSTWISGAAAVVGGGLLVILAGILIWTLMGKLGEMSADKPIEPGAKMAGRQPPPPGALKGSVTDSTLPSSGAPSAASPGLTGQTAPASVDKESFSGVWHPPVYMHGNIARVVLVQSGSSVTGRVELTDALRATDNHILLPTGTHELTGTLDADKKLTFQLPPFTGTMTLSRTGMTIWGSMSAPGGAYLGYSMDLEREVTATAKR